MTNIDTGLNAWQFATNHNRMIEFQADKTPPADGPVELAYFGSSAFRITSPRGVSVMIDPWRNHPSRNWDWYFHDFPIVPVDIGTSTHAHFDHDALNRLDAHVLLDRLIGMYKFGDMTIYGLADTLAVNFPHLRQMRVLVDGAPIATLKGHVDLRQPIHPDFSLVEEGMAPVGGILSLPVGEKE